MQEEGDDHPNPEIADELATPPPAKKRKEDGSPSNAVDVFTYEGNRQVVDLPIFLNDVRSILSWNLEDALAERKIAIKVFLSVFSRMVRNSNQEGDTETDQWFRSKTHNVFGISEIEEEMDAMVSELLHSVAEFTREGSGWQIDAIHKVDVNIAKYQP